MCGDRQERQRKAWLDLKLILRNPDYTQNAPFVGQGVFARQQQL